MYTNYQNEPQLGDVSANQTSVEIIENPEFYSVIDKSNILGNSDGRRNADVFKSLLWFVL